ncbi:sulfotransferase [Algoriphagus lutimaris]|uniref:sulfotransferase family protein n=1 Tax=Algoriphagus lutimaris TaxID=613197 RepID=UPI00196B383A|nr:sulfotransferase [Algoriphagus lutimaris]MBN3518711.1 sulfotransferase [Algoriphagus lutimaris]
MEKDNLLDFIFVGGMPRSGTTLIGQLTSQSKDVFGIKTDNSIINYLPKIKNVSFDLTNSDLDLVIHNLIANTTARKWKLTVEEVKSVTEEFPVSNWYDLAICFMIAAKNKFKKIIYIKSPGLEFYFSKIEQHLPDKYARKYVYVVRSPLDSYLSMKYAGLAWRNKIGRLVDTSVNWAFRWRQSVNMYLLNKELLKENIFLIRHEDNLEDREKVFKKYFEFLGLELTKKVLNHKNERQSSLAGHSEIKRELTRVEIENISNYCFDYMKLFDYLPESERSNSYTDFRLTEIDFMESKEIAKTLSKIIIKNII